MVWLTIYFLKKKYFIIWWSFKITSIFISESEITLISLHIALILVLSMQAEKWQTIKAGNCLNCFLIFITPLILKQIIKWPYAEVWPISLHTVRYKKSKRKSRDQIFDGDDHTLNYHPATIEAWAALKLPCRAKSCLLASKPSRKSVRMVATTWIKRPTSCNW